MVMGKAATAASTVHVRAGAALGGDCVAGVRPLCLSGGPRVLGRLVSAKGPTACQRVTLFSRAFPSGLHDSKHQHNVNKCL